MSNAALAGDMDARIKSGHDWRAYRADYFAAITSGFDAGST